MMDLELPWKHTAGLVSEGGLTDKERLPLNVGPWTGPYQTTRTPWPAASSPWPSTPSPWCVLSNREPINPSLGCSDICPVLEKELTESLS